MEDTNLRRVLNLSTLTNHIYKTNNYDLFSIIKGNREIVDGNVERIKKSIEEDGYIGGSIIICAYDPNDFEKPLKILDGQHRFNACRMAGEDIHYTINFDINVEDAVKMLDAIRVLNTSTKDWDTTDFMQSWAERGNINYELYRDIYNEYPDFDHQIIFYILNNKYVIEHGKQSGKPKRIDYKTIQEGNLELNQDDIDYLRYRLDELKIFHDIKVDNTSISKAIGKRYYLKSLDLLLNVNKFDKEHLISKLHEQFRALSKVSNIEGALEQIRNVYNRNKRIEKLMLSSSTPGVYDKITIE
jgi:hypothetical protein